MLQRSVISYASTSETKIIQIDRPGNDIAYVLAYGPITGGGSGSIVFDNLVAQRKLSRTLAINGNDLVAIDSAGATTTYLSNIGTPIALAGDGDARQFVLNSAGMLIEFNGPQSVVSTRPLGITDVNGLTFDGNRLYVSTSQGTLHVVDVATLNVLKTIPAPATGLLAWHRVKPSPVSNPAAMPT